MVQYSFQMFMGVTTMAIPAQIFPESFAGTGAGISACLGKIGASVGTYLFSYWASNDHYQRVFAVTSGVTLLGVLVTFVFVPHYNAQRLEASQRLSAKGDEAGAIKALYGAADVYPESAQEPLA